jgi:hypothetical protein
MVLLYSTPGRGKSYFHLRMRTIYLSLIIAFLIEEKSLEDLLRSTVWSGSAVLVLITTFGERS